MAELRGNKEEWAWAHQLASADFSRAWEGRPSECCEEPECCFGLHDRSNYAAHFALEFAALGASLSETVKMTLDLFGALDREHHQVEEPYDLVAIHFEAVHPDRIRSGVVA